MEKNLAFFIRIEKLRKSAKKKKIEKNVVLKTLREAYENRIIFKSQKDLILYLQSKFKDKKLPSKEKIRKAAIIAGYKIKYFTKKIEKEFEKCPICSSNFSEHYSINLKGEKILDFYFCKFCGFKTKDKKDLPIKFKFIL